MRDPSLHILKSDLVKILNEIDYNQRTMGSVLAESIFKHSQTFQIKSRYLKLLDSKAKTKKKLARSLEADIDVPDKVVEMFNLVLMSIRQKQNPHIRVKPILKTGSDYLMLKEVAKLAHDFTKHFGIEPVKEGYIEYVELGLLRMRKYGLNRFKYYDTKIYESLSDKILVLSDDRKSSTLEFYARWQEAMIEYTGLSDMIDIEDDFNKFSYIVLGRREADEANADYGDWMVAQFEGLAFVEATPELAQLSGEYSIKRFDRYIQGSSVEITENTPSVTDIYRDE